MKNKIGYMALAVCSAMLSLPSYGAVEPELQSEAKQAIDAFKKADSTIGTFFNDSTGFAIFPSVGKGGFIVGGAHGKGLVYQKDQLIGTATLTQASIGAQAGGQTFSELIFFETPDSLNSFKSGKFEMSADVSAVAAAEGVAKSARFRQGVAVFTLPKKGLMVQASIGGQKFRFDPVYPAPTGRTEPVQPGQPAQPGQPSQPGQPAQPIK